MRLLARYAFGAVLLTGIVGCATTRTPEPEPIVAVVDGRAIRLDELRAYHDRNRIGTRPDSISAGQQLREFLPLYVDYQVKLAVARENGYFEDAATLEELASYERQTAYPYWMENRVKEELLNEFVARSRDEIHASHILVSLQENASPADTLRIWNRMMEARAKAMAGEDFDSLSNVYSSYQQGRSMGGDLGWFSAGWAVKPFEDAAYTTRPGAFSMPVRTQFGYHVVHVKARRPATPDRLVHHIFFPSGEDSASIAAAMEQAQPAMRELEAGRGFTEVAIEHSQDAQSAPMGGHIGWINRGRYLPTFTDVVMEMDPSLPYSQPFYSGYGVHIIWIDSVRTYADDAAFRAEKLAQLQQMPHFRDAKNATLAFARRSGGERVETANLVSFEEAVDTQQSEEWRAVRLPGELLTRPAYHLDGTTYTLGDFKSWLDTRIDSTARGGYRAALKEAFFDAKADERIVSITRREFPAFAELTNQYLNGLASFRVSEDSVWNYVKTDSAAVRALYDRNPDAYRFETRYSFHRITATNDSLITRAAEELKRGTHPDSLRTRVSGLVIRADQISDLSQEPFENLTGLSVNEVSRVFEYRGRPTVLFLSHIDPARTMTFEEAYFRVVSDYQPMRERTWLDAMHARYGVTLHPERILD